jgi:hypothetical protein
MQALLATPRTLHRANEPMTDFRSPRHTTAIDFVHAALASIAITRAATTAKLHALLQTLLQHSVCRPFGIRT